MANRPSNRPSNASILPPSASILPLSVSILPLSVSTLPPCASILSLKSVRTPSIRLPSSACAASLRVS